MNRAEIYTFGCRLNAYESEVIKKQTIAAGVKNIVVVNSCAVTLEAERQVRQCIRKARREFPGAKIIVTGCAAQIDPKKYSIMTEVDQVIGNHEKTLYETWSNLDLKPKVFVNEIKKIKETSQHLIEGFNGKARAFIEIQQGCDHRCTFCVIPLGRGQNRSVPMGSIVEQVRILLGKGYQEVVLTGVDITDYGKDLPGKPSLGQMVKRLIALVPELPRLRLSSLDPAEIDDDLYSLIEKEPRLMPYFHISIQSGDNIILKRMKRRHRRSDIEEFVNRVRKLRSDAVFGADFIVGFPTENEEAFAKSLSLVEECAITWLHVFPYSERPGTPAAKMPQVPVEIRRKRASALRKIGLGQVHSFLDKQVGTRSSILLEKNTEGRAPNFAMVKINQNFKEGKILPVLIVAREQEKLIARVEK